MIGPLAGNPNGAQQNTDAEHVRYLLQKAKKSLRCEICGTTKMKDGKRKLSQCSRCQMVDYCCRRHQKIDWPFHKLFCGRDQKQVLEKFSDLQRDVNNKDNNFLSAIADKINQWFNPSSTTKKIERDLTSLPLLFSSVLLQDVQGVKMALKEPQNHVQIFKKRNILHLAVKSSHVEIVRLLLEQDWIDPCGLQANRFATKFTCDPNILQLLSITTQARTAQVRSIIRDRIQIYSLQSLILSYLFFFDEGRLQNPQHLFTPIIWRNGVPPFRKKGCPDLEQLQLPFYYHKNGLWTKVMCCMMTTQVNQNLQPVHGTLIVREIGAQGDWGRIIRLKIPFLYGQDAAE